ncbi:MAG: hypothetical protein AAEJ53_12170, partial [Myxococcota bacterium]
MSLDAGRMLGRLAESLLTGRAFDLAIPDWDTYNNNEPFMGRMRDTDLRQIFTDSGFARNRYFDGYVPNDKLNNDKKVTFRGGNGKK